MNLNNDQVQKWIQIQAFMPILSECATNRNPPTQGTVVWRKHVRGERRKISNEQADEKRQSFYQKIKELGTFLYIPGDQREIPFLMKDEPKNYTFIQRDSPVVYRKHENGDDYKPANNDAIIRDIKGKW